MTTEEAAVNAPQEGACRTENSAADSLSSQRVFKKSSPNGKLTLYLSSRDLVVSSGRIDKLQGVLLIDPDFVESRKVYGQVTLTFRYGREDEEVMGLKFCNEAIMCLAQLYPACKIPEGNTPLQDALLKRLGPNAYPFNMEITPLAPPSVQLVPAKEYNGAPIGTSYDVRAYVADRPDEKLHRRTTVRMGIRVVQRAFAPPSPLQYVPGGKGITCKEKAKQNRKALLFGCRSAPLDVKFSKDQENISRSAETSPRPAGGKISVEKEVLSELEAKGPAQPITSGEDSKLENHENKANSHVSFKEVLTNGNEPPDYTNPDSKAEEEEDKDAKQIEETPSLAEHENEIEHFRSLCGGKRPSLAAYLAGVPAPRASVEKPFLLSDGRIHLTASLDKAIYSHGEEIHVNVQIENNSNKTIRRIKVFVVQHVDVCMFSNGKFKNVVAMLNTKENCPIISGGNLDQTFTLLPLKSSTKNWIALEDSYTKSGTSLASTVTTTENNPDDRNVFAIYVSYYVKVKLMVSVMGGEVSLKLPFTLMHTCSEFDHMETLTRVQKMQKASSPNVELELKAPTTPVIKQEKDGT